MTRREMNHVSSIALGAAAMALMAGRAVAGPVPRIAHTLHGTVVAVDAADCKLTVQARRRPHSNSRSRGRPERLPGVTTNGPRAVAACRLRWTRRHRMVS